MDEKTKDKTRQDREARIHIERLTAKVIDLVRYAVTGVWNDSEAHGQGARSKIGNLAVRSILRPRSPAPLHVAHLFHGALDRSRFRPARSYRPWIRTLRLTAGTALQFLSITAPGDIHRSAIRRLHTSAQPPRDCSSGVGIVVLLWTISSLLSYIEDAFNTIWHVKTATELFPENHRLYRHLPHHPRFLRYVRRESPYSYRP